MDMDRKDRLIRNLVLSILLDNSIQLLSTQKVIIEDIDAIKSENKETKERE